MAITDAYHKYGSVSNYDILKAIAAVAMTLDHIGLYLYPDELWWRSIGRMAASLYFFFIGFSTHHTIRRDLLFFAVLLIPLNPLTGIDIFPLNVLVSIIAARLMLNLLDNKQLMQREPLMVWLACAVFALPTYAVSEYGSFAILFAGMGYIARHGLRGTQHKTYCVLACTSYCVLQYVLFDFSPLQTSIMVVTVCTTCWLLYHFTKREVQNAATRLLQIPIKLSARYSLHYYALHRALLQLLG